MNGSPQPTPAPTNAPSKDRGRTFEPHSVQSVMNEAAKLSEDASNAVKAATGTVSGTAVQTILHKISGRK